MLNIWIQLAFSRRIIKYICVTLSQVLLQFALPFFVKNPPLNEQFLPFRWPKIFQLESNQLTQTLSHNNKACHNRAIWRNLAKNKFVYLHCVLQEYSKCQAYMKHFLRLHIVIKPLIKNRLNKFFITLKRTLLKFLRKFGACQKLELAGRIGDFGNFLNGFAN